MKHAITSYNTKKKLAASLKRAMAQKPFNKITVSEIMLDCDLNRKTFYYHFEDLNGLLHWMLEDDANALLEALGPKAELERTLHFALDYIEDNEAVVRCVLESVTYEDATAFFRLNLPAAVTKCINDAERSTGILLDEPYRQFLIRFHTNALVSYIVAWALDHDDVDRGCAIRSMMGTLQQSLDGILQHQKTMRT
ncbi:MAG: hypothetical protein PUC32_00065 [Oscillospiraceae bacterium]|nr:hypothetical protein [Oscillospiraceae bacterium]